MGGLSAERLERQSRALLLKGDVAGGWLALREAFALDQTLQCSYAEGDEAPRPEPKDPLADGWDRLPSRRLLKALARAKTAPGLAWRGALRRRVLDYHGAADDLSRARRLGERGPDVLAWLGEAKLQLGLENGVADLKAAARGAGARAWHHAWLGRALVTLRKDPAGLKELDRAVALSPHESLFYAWRGIARLRLSTRKKAVADLDRALELNAGKDSGWLRAWRALALPPGKAALAALASAARELPDYTPLSFGLARARRAAGRYTEWIETLDRVSRRDRKFAAGLPAQPRAELEALEKDLSRARGAAALRWLGRVRALLGRQEEGLAALDASLRAEKKDSLTLLWRAEALCALGRGKEALADFDAAARDAACAAEARRGRAKALAAAGNVKGALAELSRAARLDPGSAATQGELGAFRLLSGDWRGAAEALARAVAREPGYLDARVDLALARGRLGERAAQKRGFAAARKDSPEHVQARLSRWAEHWRACGLPPF